MLLNQGEGEDPKEIAHVLHLVKDIGHVAIGGADRLIAERERKRTMRIDARGVHGNDFDMPTQAREDLLRRGDRAAEEFLAECSWARYVRRFRSGRARIPGRVPEHLRMRPLAAPDEELEGVEYLWYPAGPGAR
ncbi:MAG: hypothetical protein FJZ92_11825 [Chloroflexi bacterium]|nr:hypothetical protein [Chloroflexota bacterium]